MYVVMATAVHMDYTLPLKQGISFQMLCKQGIAYVGYLCSLMQLHTHQIYRNTEHSRNIAPSAFVLASYFNTMVLTSERH